MERYRDFRNAMLGAKKFLGGEYFTKFAIVYFLPLPVGQSWGTGAAFWPITASMSTPALMKSFRRGTPGTGADAEEGFEEMTGVSMYLVGGCLLVLS